MENLLNTFRNSFLIIEFAIILICVFYLVFLIGLYVSKKVFSQEVVIVRNFKLIWNDKFDKMRISFLIVCILVLIVLNNTEFKSIEKVERYFKDYKSILTLIRIVSSNILIIICPFLILTLLFSALYTKRVWGIFYPISKIKTYLCIFKTEEERKEIYNKYNKEAFNCTLKQFLHFSNLNERDFKGAISWIDKSSKENSEGNKQSLLEFLIWYFDLEKKPKYCKKELINLTSKYFMINSKQIKYQNKEFVDFENRKISKFSK